LIINIYIIKGITKYYKKEGEKMKKELKKSINEIVDSLKYFCKEDLLIKQNNAVILRLRGQLAKEELDKKSG